MINEKFIFFVLERVVFLLSKNKTKKKSQKKSGSSIYIYINSLILLINQSNTDRWKITKKAILKSYLQ